MEESAIGHGFNNFKYTIGKLFFLLILMSFLNTKKKKMLFNSPELIETKVLIND